MNDEGPVKKTRVLIGIPAFEGVQYEAQQSLFSMVYRVGRDLPNVELAVHVGYKREQFRARNQIVDAAIAADMDYLLMLDDDMIVPHNLLQQLMAHDKDIIGALYYQRGGAYEPVIMRRESQEKGDYRAHFLSLNDPILTSDRGLHEVDVIGGGCMLFKTDTFKSILQPYFVSEIGYGTDITICGRLKDEGHEIWVDTSIELGHVGERQIITSRSIPAAQRVMAKVNIELTSDLKEYLGHHDESLNSAMIRAARKTERQEHWDADASDWDTVKSHYQENSDWHLLNLAYFNLMKPDPYKEWALSRGLDMLKPGSRLIDYGAGLGHISMPLAQHGHSVQALDIGESATQGFVKWREVHHGLSEHLHPRAIYGEVPNWEDKETIDGAFCISVMDHLTKPYETVQWIYRQLKPGAFFVCEWYLQSGEDEPQHLDRYDLQTFEAWMHEIGFTTSPEHSWLFFKSGG